MTAADYSFLFKPVDLHNIGQLDIDNAFLRHGNGLAEDLAAWMENTPGAIPIGVCHEAARRCCGVEYIPMVFEDEDGRRYYVHVPGYWGEEARVAAQGPQAMKKARDCWWTKTIMGMKADQNDKTGGRQ